MSDSEFDNSERDSRDTESFATFAARRAHAYNAPQSEVPRDAMWAAIAAQRATAREQARTHAHVVGRERAFGRYRFAAYAAALAATLVIGVAIGRYGRKDAIEPTTLATQSAVPPQVAPLMDSSSGSFGAAAVSHLSRAEALLTTYQAARGDGRIDNVNDTQLSTWARDLLSDTRLLLDSPAATDPQRRQLLNDLELVLVQLVQRAPPDGAKEERSLVTRTIERTHVLTRLRSAQRRTPSFGT